MLNFIQIFHCILIIKLFKKKYLPNKYKHKNKHKCNNNKIFNSINYQFNVFSPSFLLISHVLSPFSSSTFFIIIMFTIGGTISTRTLFAKFVSRQLLGHDETTVSTLSTTTVTRIYIYIEGIYTCRRNLRIYQG